MQGECATDRPRHQKRAVRCSRRQSRLAAHVLKTCEPRCTQVCEHPYPSFGLGDLPVLRSMRCRSLSRVRLSASRSAGDSVEVRSGVVGMRLVCHDLDWHAHRARHENCTDCTMNSKALPPPFPERAKQDLVQGPRGPSESESRKTNAFAPTASVQDSRDLSARAVGDELRRIVALTIQPCRAAPTVRCLREGQDSSFVVTVHLSCRRSSDGVLRVYPGCSRGGRGADCGLLSALPHYGCTTAIVSVL